MIDDNEVNISTNKENSLNIQDNELNTLHLVALMKNYRFCFWSKRAYYWELLNGTEIANELDAAVVMSFLGVGAFDTENDVLGYMGHTGHKV